MVKLLVIIFIYTYRGVREKFTYSYYTRYIVKIDRKNPMLKVPEKEICYWM